VNVHLHQLLEAKILRFGFERTGMIFIFQFTFVSLEKPEAVCIIASKLWDQISAQRYRLKDFAWTCLCQIPEILNQVASNSFPIGILPCYSFWIFSCATESSNSFRHTSWFIREREEFIPDSVSKHFVSLNYIWLQIFFSESSLSMRYSDHYPKIER